MNTKIQVPNQEQEKGILDYLGEFFNEPVSTGEINVEHLANIYQDVLEERARQEQLKAEGKFRYSCADLECTDDIKHRYLTEEVGEVSRELNERETALWKGVPYDSANLRAELIQVAAVAVAWVEALDKESAK